MPEETTGSTRFKTVRLFNRAPFPVSFTFDGTDEPAIPAGEDAWYPFAVAMHAVRRTTVKSNPMTDENVSLLTIIEKGQEPPPMLTEEEACPEQLLDVDNMPATAFAPDGAPLKSKAIPLQPDVRLTRGRGMAPEQQRAAYVPDEPRPGWRKDMDEAASMAAEAAASIPPEAVDRAVREG